MRITGVMSGCALVVALLGCGPAGGTDAGSSSGTDAGSTTPDGTVAGNDGGASSQ